MEMHMDDPLKECSGGVCFQRKACQHDPCRASEPAGTTDTRMQAQPFCQPFVDLREFCKLSSNDPNAQSTHTPGPWSLDHFGKVITPHGNLLATGISLPCGNHPEAKEAEANTRLIAAAPDLLAVLQEAVASNRKVEDPDWWVRVLAAISKAKQPPTKPDHSE